MRIRVGLIGSGFIGKAHALAYRTAPSVFDLPADVSLAWLADVDDETAARAAAELGFEHSTGDWRRLVGSDDVDVVDITTPNHLHEEMAMAAIAAGKHVYCEKPLAPTVAAARRMTEAAEAAGVKTLVGFNYLKNPITALAKEIIDSGEIGEVFGYKGTHFEDYMLDPETLVNAWRLDPASGDGVTGDLGSHALSMARHLVGDIESLVADRHIVTRERPFGAEGAPQPVEVADALRTMVRFADGAKGTIEASWMAPGRKHTIAAEVWGTKGALSFDFERLNELQLYRTDQQRGREGFTTILAGPTHGDYAAFVPAPGHQLSFNDLKTIEIRDLVEGLTGDDGPWPDFREAMEVQRLVDACVESDRTSTWVDISAV